MPHAPHSGDWISLLALTALWGSAFLLNEIALASLPPSILVASRILIAAALIFGYLRLTGGSLPAPGRAWMPMFVLAVFGNVVPFHLVAWSQQYIDSSLAGVLMAVMPLFVLTLAHFLVPGARLTFFRAAGFVVGFVGVVCIIGPDLERGLDGNLALWGAIAALGAALSYSISAIYARRLGAGDPLRRSAGMLIVASILSLPAAAFDMPAITTPSIGAVVALLVLGLLTTGFATLLYFRLVQGPGPTFLSLVNYLVPAWAVVAGVLFLDESLSPSLFVGLVLILSGIALSEIGPRVLHTMQALRARSLTSSVRRVAREDA
jgi:drug/metabolite transporter (DMT)-like permease